MKEQFKKEVLEWLAKNSIFPKKVRVYDSPRYGLEVRVYGTPLEYVSERVSFRTSNIEKIGDNMFQRHGTRGHHMIKHSNYVPINKENLSSKEEEQFTLDTIRMAL